MNVTMTDNRAGKFEAKFFHKILQEDIGGVKGYFWTNYALAFNPDGQRLHLRKGRRHFVVEQSCFISTAWRYSGAVFGVLHLGRSCCTVYLCRCLRNFVH